MCTTLDQVYIRARATQIRVSPINTTVKILALLTTQARSFESKLLNQDHMTPELYKFKNKEGGLVVLYCNEEKEACHVSLLL